MHGDNHVARIEVPMPQMGESIAEGTVSRWLKQVGDAVERDEPILEISTDKVDAEIPAPQSGTLVEVAVEEGETVEVGTIVAYIDTEGGQASSADDSDEGDEAGDDPDGEDEDPSPEQETAPESDEDEKEDEKEAETDSRSQGEEDEPESAEERLKQRSTPVVRRMAEEHGVELSEVTGSGHAGRVTKQDLLDHMEKAEAAPDASEEPAEEKAADRKEKAAPARSEGRPATAAPSELWKTFYGEVQHPEFPVRDADRVETMDKIRRLTAEHMVVAKRIVPHVHSFIEIDFTRIDRIRRENKKKWSEQGARVSFTAFVTWAISRVLRDFPMVNATASGNNIIYRGNVNVGIAVDLDPGLIVPVIRDADHLSLVGIGSKVMDLAERARSRRLSPDEIQGATFSITNPGVLGTMVGLPIIPKGTAGILGTGAIEKRVVVVEDPETGEDSIAIRKRSIFSLGYDHRIVDGADAARFLYALKEMLEGFPEDA
ncbi:MAG: 2-oxo acid dehydrogenase subunit E2 [Gemmatimonadales bacterium]|nr:MAG: 2-oxo acid dehydrogenase subunit E2 [Gemmatimonadales bacterium]